MENDGGINLVVALVVVEIVVVPSIVEIVVTMKILKLQSIAFLGGRTV